jgi:ER-bound oxygenase mpaB/B'/Rubber oxygenase, catalytic domain
MRDRVIDAQNDRESGHEQDPSGRWSQSEFRRLRNATDPEIERVVSAYQLAHPELADARELVRSMIQELSLAKNEPQWFTRDAAGHQGTLLTAAFDIVFADPRWNADQALIELGQRAFADNGLYQAAALFFASLPMAYATIDGARVLASVSDLATANLTRRVAETGQMLVDVMGLRGPHSLEPGSPGYMTAAGLRLMHACVRVLILDQPEPDQWPTEVYGPPANQELMLGTLLDFTVVAWAAMDRMGVGLNEAERAANLHAWSFIGQLMGIEACRDGPLSLADVTQIGDQMTRHLGPSEAGQRLMAALLADMEEFMPLGWRKLPRSVVRWLFQDASYPVNTVPDLLGVPPAAWWSIPLQAWLRAANQHSWWLGPVSPLAHALIREVGRQVVIGYADRYSHGQAPFRFPVELGRNWRIGTTPAHRAIRGMRRDVRRAVRAVVPQGGQRGRGRGAP